MKNSIIAASLLCSFAFSNEILIDTKKEKLLSSTQKNILDTKKRIINEQNKIDKKSWISDINLQASIGKNKQGNKNSKIAASYNQDIFRFGAIIYGINLAKIQQQYDLLNLDMTYENYIKTIYTNALYIQILETKIKKQELNIKNKQISVQIKKDAYKEGQTNISDLNDAIISYNSQEENLVELLKNKEDYVENLKKYSNIDYEKIEVPSLKPLSNEEYLELSKDIKLAEKNINLKQLNYQIIKATYLPKLSINANGGYEDTSSSSGFESYYNYGLQVSMPIDFSSSNKKEKAKLNKLLAKKQKEQKLIEKNSEYKKVLNSIERYNKLIKISQKDIKLYTELLQVINDEYKAGYKSSEDVEILLNSKKIKEYDKKLNELNIQKEIISLYF